MEIRLLRYFLAVAEEGNISKAALRLHVTQPTLSRQLQDLEWQLGRPLFIRGYHRLDLTPEGVLLKSRAEEIISLADRTSDEIAHSGAEISGDVILGCAETHLMRNVIAIIKRVVDAHPGVHFHLRSDVVGALCDGLDKGTRDFGVVIGGVDSARYENLELPWSLRWGLYVREDHPLAAKPAIRLADLQGQPLVCSRQVERSDGERGSYPGWFGESFHKMRVAVRNDLSYPGALLVEEGVGLLVSIEDLYPFAAERGLRFVPFGPGITSSLHLVWKRGQVFNRACKLFLKEMRAAAVDP